MDDSEAAKPNAPPSPSHSEESLEFRYIEDIGELPPIEPDASLHHMWRFLDYDLDPMTSNVNSYMRNMPGITSSYMNNAYTPTRQTSQSNSALSSLDISTSQNSHQMSPLHETPQRDLHHSQDIWTNELDYFSQSSAPIIREGFNQNRSNKRRKPEGAGCKNCKCKKANCLKLYCKCFASGDYCTGSCSCQNCYNIPTHEEKVIAARTASKTRNHLAFAPKVRSADSLSENGVDPNKTPASTVHIRGCNCKKSKCENNYCECHENGVPCSIKCRCIGCNNPYGGDSCYSELGPETGTQINESYETLMAENVSHPNSTASSPTPSWAASSNASLGGSSRRERLNNFDIPDASEANASQRLNESNNILPNQLNVGDASYASWAASSNTSLGGSSRGEQPSNFGIPDASEFNASQSNNILRNQLNLDDNFRSNPALQMPYIQQVGDGSFTTYINLYINNSSNSAREMIHYHSSPPFPSPTSSQHPTPDSNPTTPGNSSQHQK